MTAHASHGDELRGTGHFAAFFGDQPTVTMAHGPELLALIQRIEANQRQERAAQTGHLKLAQAQFAASEAMVARSLKVQRAAIDRQQRRSPLILPVILLLIVPVV